MNGYALLEIIGEYEIEDHEFNITIYAKNQLNSDQILRAYSLIYMCLNACYLIKLKHGIEKIDATPSYSDYVVSRTIAG